MDGREVIEGDCRHVMRRMGERRFDAVVTDPRYAEIARRRIDAEGD